MNTLLKTKKNTAKYYLPLAASALLLAPGLNAQTTTNWIGDEGFWRQSTNWDNGVPLDGSYNTNINSGVATLDDFGQVRLLRVGATSGSNGYLNIVDGATLQAGGAGAHLVGATGGVGVINQTGGYVTFGHNLILGGSGSTTNGGSGTYSISGGTLGLVLAGSRQDLLLSDNTTGASTSLFNQAGGDVLVGNLLVGARRFTGGATTINTATFSISGGTLDVQGNWTHGTDTTNGGGRIDATSEIIGSASSITVNGDVILNQNSRNDSTLRFSIDDGGVSKINVSGSGNVKLAGTLDAGVKGGVALTSSTSFTLIEAAAGNISGSFEDGPNSELWNVQTVAVDGGREAVQLSLQASAEKAVLSYNANQFVGQSFTASGVGYVTLNDLQVGDTIALHFAANAGTDKSISDLIAYLDEHGILAAESTESGYSIVISKEVEESSSYFSWDLSEFNGDASISAIGVSIIPEPAQVSALIGGLAVAFALVLRKKNMK